MYTFTYMYAKGQDIAACTIKLTFNLHHTYIVLTPLTPHFYTVKLGFIEVYIYILIFAQNIDCGYSLEPPRRGGFTKYPQFMF